MTNSGKGLQTAHHILVVTVTDVEGALHYTIECPGVTDACRAWDPCQICPLPMSDDQSERLREDEEAHGVEHRHLLGEWMVPTDECFLVGFDDLRDPASDLELGLGRWPVIFGIEDDGEYLTLDLAERAS